MTPTETIAQREARAVQRRKEERYVAQQLAQSGLSDWTRTNLFAAPVPLTASNVDQRVAEVQQIITITKTAGFCASATQDYIKAGYSLATVRAEVEKIAGITQSRPVPTALRWGRRSAGR